MRLTITILVAAFFLLCNSGCYASTNDSVPALAKSVSELPPDSSVLDLAEGVYRIASTWTISRPGIIIRGAGIGKTVLIRDPQFDGIMVNMKGANGTITGLTLDGNGTARVIFLSQPRVKADTIEVKHFTHIGIAVPASGCRVTNCLIDNDPTTQTTMAVWHDAGATTKDSTIMIDHNVVKNTGIYCTGGQITITDNQISGEPNPSGGQIDIGNAFTTNTVATITGNSIHDGGTIRTSGIETGGGSFTVANNVVRNHGLSGISVGRNAIRATVTGNTVSNSGHCIADKNDPQVRSGIYVGSGAANVEIADNRCFDDQPNKTQTWGIILVGLPTRPDARFSRRTTDHVLVRQNDLRGNIHPEGLLADSRPRDTLISGNLPPQANR